MKVTPEDTHPAVVQSGHVLVGPQRQLRLLVVVQPPAHVVQVLEVEGRDCRDRRGRRPLFPQLGQCGGPTVRCGRSRSV